MSGRWHGKIVETLRRRDRMRPAIRILASLFAVLFTSTLGVEAQTPRGPEIVVSPASTEFQIGDAAVAANGSFAVTWSKGGLRPGLPSQGWFRLFRADGTPRTPELRISNSPWNQGSLSIAMRPDGGFVVVWCEQVPGHRRVLGRRFAASGTPLGAPFRLSRTLLGNQCGPDVAMAADGSFVAAWSSDHIAAVFRDTPDIFARRFTAEGRPRGPEFLVNQDTFEEQGGAQVAVAPGGAFVVGWSSWNGEGNFWDVEGQRFAADGTPQGDELAFAENPEASQRGFGLAMSPDGGFVVVYHDPGADWDRDLLFPNPGDGILGRRYGPNTILPGPSFHVNAAAPGAQAAPSITATPAGFFAAWTIEAGPNLLEASGVFGRRLSSSGTPVGPDMQIASGGAISAPIAVALNASGRGVAVWTAYDPDADTFELRARRLVTAPPR